MSTIREVARLAGVSPITVSRVLNQSGPVNVETRIRVETAISQLNYVPNVLARSFRSKRTQTLALILTDITNPFWTRIARGVEDTARQAGYSVIMCNTDENEVIQLDTVNLVLQKQVDGILLVPRRNGAALVERIRAQHVPVVVLDRRIPALPQAPGSPRYLGGTWGETPGNLGEAPGTWGVDTVRGDSEAGAYQLTRLLLDLGHRRITLLSGPQDVPTSADRAAGFQRALCEVGCESGCRVIYDEYSHASGYTSAQRALSESPRPTALFAGNNLIATGALRAVREMTLKVPEDVSLVCFDDFPLELLVDPFFTTAAQPAYELGCQATRLLLERLAGKNDLPPQEIVLPVEIIARRSSGPVYM